MKSNRKKARMDAIERRLADLEAMVFGDGPEDSAPDWLSEHGWVRTRKPLGGSDGQWWATMSPLGTSVAAVQDSAVKQQQEWNAAADLPEFSRQPEGTGEPEPMEYDQDFLLGLRTLCGNYGAGGVREALDAGLGEWPRPPADDVRERVREAAEVADGAAVRAAEREAHWRNVTGPSEEPYWEAHAVRYEESLRQLLAIADPSSTAGAYGRIAEMHALIEGVLDGGTITPEGLRRNA